MKRPAVSEIVTAIVLFAVMAAAIGTVLIVFNERQADIQEVTQSRIDISHMKASELLAVTDARLDAQKCEFILHNYSKDHNARFSEFDIYKYGDDGNIEETILPAEFADFGGAILYGTNSTGTELLYNGTSVITTLEQCNIAPGRDLANDLLIITPARDFIRVDIP